MSQDVDDIMRKLNMFVVDVEKVVDDAVFVTATKVQRGAIDAIREPSAGRRYGKHVASKKGDAPNTDTGRLIGSIKTVHKRLSMRALVGTNLAYGAILELIKNRPWLKPALNDNVKDYKKNLELVIDKQIRDAGK